MDPMGAGLVFLMEVSGKSIGPPYPLLFVKGNDRATTYVLTKWSQGFQSRLVLGPMRSKL